MSLTFILFVYTNLYCFIEDYVHTIGHILVLYLGNHCLNIITVARRQ